MKKIIGLLMMVTVMLSGCGNTSNSSIWNGDYAIMTAKTSDNPLCTVVDYQDYKNYKAKNTGCYESFSPEMEEPEDKHYLLIESEYHTSRCDNMKVKSVVYQDEKLVVTLKESETEYAVIDNYALVCIIPVDQVYKNIEVVRDCKYHTDDKIH